jgi:hypothetical protein
MTSKDLDNCIAQWSSFCDTIKTSGSEILAAAEGMDATTQADGLRYLSRMLRAGLEKFVEYGDPLDPTLYKVYHEKLKWGGDNPDSIYNLATISGEQQYELTGNRGSVRYFNIMSATMSADGKMQINGFLNDDDISCDAEGNFILSLSQATDGKNCLPLEPSSNMLMIRQTFNDRKAEQEVQASLRCVSSQINSAASIETLSDNLTKAAGFFSRTGDTFAKQSVDMAKDINTLPAVDLEYITSLGGDPNYTYFWSAFDVSPEKALLIHLPYMPACDTWSLCLYNFWLESLDYHKTTVILNKFTAQANPDGSVTMVICSSNPDTSNWLDSCHRQQGNIIFRWTRAEEPLAPQTKLVDLNDAKLPEYFKRW